FPAAHAACLAMLAPVMTMNEGARIYSPGGSLLEAGGRLEQPGLATALELLATEGPASAYSGTIGQALLALSEERGGLVTAADPLLGPFVPGERRASMMAPMLVLNGDGLELAAGAAGGTRLRSALLQSIAGVLDEGLEPQEAVARSRLHPADGLVHLEPGFE